MGRHPNGVRLGAWFDGEGDDGVGGHVVDCSRCQKRVSELARIRAWVRAQPFFAMGDEAPRPAPGALHRSRPVVVPALLVLLFFLLAPSRPWAGRNQPIDATRDSAARQATPPSRAPPAQPSGAAALPPGPGLDDGAAGTTGGVAQPPGEASPAPPGPLRLGLVVPTTGPLAAEGTEITEVVRRRIALANAGGGVGGLPVELVVVRAEDRPRVAAIGDRVTALIGGFGAAPPGGVPWLLPADPSITGPDVLATEAAPFIVGSELGTLLHEQGLRGVIGVVRGAGPDADLADGLASRARTATVPLGGDGSCNAEVASLRGSGAQALAVAAPPDVAARCLEAAGRTGWHPPFGTLVAPSAAYAGVPVEPQLGGPRTVLGLPWPTWEVPGAARFRASTHSSSYRALVSFAAAELAIDVARQGAGVSLPAMAMGSWRSDLFDLIGTTSQTGAVVVAGVGSWVQSPPVPVPGIVAGPLLPPPPHLLVP
jgi:hypothetical protein